MCMCVYKRDRDPRLSSCVATTPENHVEERNIPVNSVAFSGAAFSTINTIRQAHFNLYVVLRTGKERFPENQFL